MSELRFTPASYLKDRLPAIIGAVLCCAVVFGMGKVLGLSNDSAGIITAFVLMMSIALFTYDYLRKRAFFQQVADTLEELQSAYQLPSLVARPAFLEGSLAYDAMNVVAKSDADLLSEERQMSKENREFVELWTHEVKTPIAAMKLVLARMHGKEAQILVSELERIENSCERALYSARTANVSADYAIRDVPLAKTCKDACKDLANYLIEKGVTPNIQIDPAVTVLGDGQWMRFVIKQVLSNAGKYGATAITFKAATVGEGTPEGHTLLTIEDNGCGIPENELPKVFEQGFSGTNGKRSGSSTGMGLYLSAKTCTAMGIGLSIASEQGSGTTVKLSFPHDRSRVNLASM